MNDPKKLSVIVPVFNTKPEYLEQCFSRFLNNFDSRIELIVVDDGSHEDTRSQLRSIQQRCVNSMTLILQENGGQNAARKRGIEAASGEYIGFLDSDDYIQWDDFLRVLDACDGEKDVIGFNCKVVNDSGIVADGYGYSDTAGAEEDIRRPMMAHCAELWMQIVRRPLLSEDFFCEDISIGEDLAAVFLVLSQSQSCEVLDCVPYRYRQHQGSVMHNTKPETRLDIVKSFEFMISALGPKLHSYHDELEWQAIHHILYAEVWYLLCGGLRNMDYARRLTSWVDSTFPNWKNNPYYLREPRDITFSLIVRRRFRLFAMLHKLKSILRRK